MIDNSRKRRIAAGAGVQLPEVNRLLKQFDHMQKTMKKLAKGGMLKNMMRGMGGGACRRDLDLRLRQIAPAVRCGGLSPAPAGSVATPIHGP